MTKIPDKLKAELNADPLYKTCARYGQGEHICKGKITWEHSIIYAGKQLQQKWAIVPLCEYGHSVNTYLDGGDMDKKINIWIALSQATKEQIDSICKAEDYHRTLRVLESQYGIYKRIFPPVSGQISPSEGTHLNAPIPAKCPLTSPYKPRQFWYPVNETQKQIIQKAITHFKEIEDVHYTPFQMIERMIVEFGDNLDALQAEERI